MKHPGHTSVATPKPVVKDRRPIEVGAGSGLVRCGLCHLVQRMPDMRENVDARCARCDKVLSLAVPSRLPLIRTLGLAALILYVPANLLPIVLVDYQGRHLEITIVDGVRDLFSHGHIFLGLLVMTTSFITPVLKILGLLALAFSPAHSWSLVWRRRSYDLIRMVNPWNAMEIFLLGTLFTLINFGELATVRAGGGAPAFTLVVLLTLTATIFYHPSSLWKRRDTTRP